MWQMITAAGIVTVLASVATIYCKKSKRRTQKQGQIKKMAEISAEGFVFSKEYTMGHGKLIVDNLHSKWFFMEDEVPMQAQVYTFFDIEKVRIVGKQKVYVGVRTIVGIGAIRQGATGNNTLESVTDSMRGVEVVITGRETPLFVDTLDEGCSAERVQAIFESLQERGRPVFTE